MFSSEIEQRYALLIERVGYGVYRSTPEGRFIEANSVLAGMLGYSSVDEVLALDLGQDVYLDPEERQRLRQRPSGGAFPEWVGTRWKRRDGSAITVRLLVRRLFDADGEVYAYDDDKKVFEPVSKRYAAEVAKHLALHTHD